MKKVTSVFMAFVLLLALTACNSGGASGGGKGGGKRGKQEKGGFFSPGSPEPGGVGKEKDGGGSTP